MSSETDIAAQRLLSELAELSLATARDLQGAMQAADTAQLIGLAEAFAKVGRCLRMSIALAARLARGERLGPAARETRGLEAEEERDESEFIEERPERLDDRETLFDRLPTGDLDTQIATVARVLASAARVLPNAGDYRARCETVIAAARRDLPRRIHPPDGARRGPLQAPPIAIAVAASPTRSRGPPRALNSP